mmetsp:Transcript_72268/g.209225  ORF Transcript_72268/g.209225 Transcript_72268/m.209225 type:complete len:205 (-) Transcript_72268:160-774(-)
MGRLRPFRRHLGLGTDEDDMDEDHEAAQSVEPLRPDDAAEDSPERAPCRTRRLRNQLLVPGQDREPAIVAHRGEEGAPFHEVPSELVFDLRHLHQQRRLAPHKPRPQRRGHPAEHGELGLRRTAPSNVPWAFRRHLGLLPRVDRRRQVAPRRHARGRGLPGIAVAQHLTPWTRGLSGRAPLLKRTAARLHPLHGARVREQPLDH